MSTDKPKFSLKNLSTKHVAGGAAGIVLIFATMVLLMGCGTTRDRQGNWAVLCIIAQCVINETDSGMKQIEGNETDTTVSDMATEQGAEAQVDAVPGVEQ